jgi:hypothetical protein
MHDADTNMTRTYVSVLVLEALIVALLWVIGRLYS